MDLVFMVLMGNRRTGVAIFNCIGRTERFFKDSERFLLKIRVRCLMSIAGCTINLVRLGVEVTQAAFDLVTIHPGFIPDSSKSNLSPGPAVVVHRELDEHDVSLPDTGLEIIPKETVAEGAAAGAPERTVEHVDF